MRFPRSSGILLHPTSLPGRYGIGDLGAGARRFADFLHSAGQRIWQVLPLHPTGFGDSPYQCFSAFAGNPLLISLEELRDRGYLAPADLDDAPEFSADEVDFARVIPFRTVLLRKAPERFFACASEDDRREYERFCGVNSTWLDDFALFMAAKEAHGLRAWTEWEAGLAHREPTLLHAWRERLRGEIQVHRFWQFEFDRQWRALKGYCGERGIRIMGDLPIYVAHDSAEVWSHPELFHLDQDGRQLRQAGVPPDYFSATGQLWGNPIYRWDRMRESGYRWWTERFRAELAAFDILRLDHFRGFEAYWEVNAGETTAMNGRWVKGPGAELFRHLTRELGELPIVAENLGVITPEVEAIRAEFSYPGMALLQFAFGNDPQAPSFQPHNYPRNLVAYTGGHDNDTVEGWWTGGVGDSTRSEDDVRREHAVAREYLGCGDDPMHVVMVREVMRSVADTAIVPLQDVLGLGSEARMNTPATMGGNWRWRYSPNALTAQIAARLRRWAEIYGRLGTSVP
ncbi:MAG: 4-alpha-glucanotransferase [Terriglobales bacterium]